MRELRGDRITKKGKVVSKQKWKDIISKTMTLLPSNGK